MFNHIRKVPYVAGDGRGGINYFAAGFQSQFGLETQIVATLCESNVVYPMIQKIYGTNSTKMAFWHSARLRSQ